MHIKEMALIIFLMLLTSCEAIFKKHACEMPPVPDNATFNMPARDVNSTTTYFCLDGFWYKGTNPRVCQENGEWSGTPGTCQVVQCPVLPNPPHGHVNMTGQGYKDTGTVTCDEGYIYSLPESKTCTCQRDNTWSFVIGECLAVTCPALQALPKSQIEYTGFGYNDTATVNCSAGYNYTTPEFMSVTCQGDNTWSLQFDGECKLILCPDIPYIQHRIVTSNGTSYGSVVSVLCTAGYSLKGSSTVTCTGTGQWSDVPGECVVSPTWNKHVLWCLVLLPLSGLMCFWMWKRYHCNGMRLPRWTTKAHESREIKLENQQPEQQGLLDTRRPMSDVHPGPCPVLIQQGTDTVPIVHIPDIQGNIYRSYYVSFILKNKFDAGDSNPESPEYMSFASKVQEQVKTVLQKITGEGTHVFVDTLSEQKKMVHLKVDCVKSSVESEISKALYSMEGVVKIAVGSIYFRDMESATLASEIIRQKHVKDTQMDRRIDLETQYIRLRILSMDNIEVIPRDKMELPDKYQRELHQQHSKEIADEDIVASNETEKVIVIRGRAGIGKTTLMQRLMWRWACGEWVTHLKAIFLLNLRVLASITGEVDLPYLLSHCGVYRPAHGVRAKWIEENEEQIGLGLDGLDELHSFGSLWEKETGTLKIQDSTTAANWCIMLLKRKCLQRCTLIVTTRPFKALSSLKPSSVIEVMGLTRDRVIEFIDKNVNQEKVTVVKQTMMNQPILMSVSAITFYCTALCQVLQDDISALTKLVTYTQITAHITMLFLQRSMKTSITTVGLSTSLRSMCQLAYNGLVKGTVGGLAQLVFDEQDMVHMTAKDVDIARQSGLFLQTSIPDLPNGGGRQVIGEFVNLSIQESLAMAGLLMQSPQCIKEALKTMKTTGQFNMALLFLYGFAFDTKNETLRKLGIGITEKLDAQVQRDLKNMICDVTDELQLLQMVHESQSPEIARYVGEQMFKKGVNLKDTKMTAVDFLALTFLLQHSPTVSNIYLQYMYLDPLCLKELSGFLTGNRTVTSLTLVDDGVDDRGVEFLCEALKVNVALTTLRIEGVLTDQGLSYFADVLQCNSTLEHLEIGSLKLTDGGVAHLASVLHKNTQLRSLNLSLTTVHDSGTDALLLALEQNTKVVVAVMDANCSKALHERLKANRRFKMR